MKRMRLLKLLPLLKIKGSPFEYLLLMIFVVLLLMNLICNFGKNNFSERDDFRDLISVVRTECVPGTVLFLGNYWEWMASSLYCDLMYTRRDVSILWVEKIISFNAKYIKENSGNFLPVFIDFTLSGKNLYNFDKEFTICRIETKQPLRFIGADYANFASWHALEPRALYYALPKGIQGTLDASGLHVSKVNNAKFSQVVLSNLRYVPEAEALIVQAPTYPVNLLIPKVPGKKMSLILGLGFAANGKSLCSAQGIEILFYLNNKIKSIQRFDLTSPNQEIKLDFSAEELANPFNILSLVLITDSINEQSRRISLPCLYKINYIDIRMVD
jgi:hypothetical protein